MLTLSSKYSLPAEVAGTILEQIVAARMLDVESAKLKFPDSSIRAALGRAPQVRSLKRALLRRHGIIAEIKKASPSGGLMRNEFDPVAIAQEYARGGAAAISVVTEPNFFHGSLEILAALRWQTDLPLLRKDFVFDSYQVLEARHAGADAVLLIASLLDLSALRMLMSCVEELGMDALVEVHDERDLERAVAAESKLIGVNSRDLRAFEVSLDIPLRLAARLPQNTVAIAESGIRTAEDIRRLTKAGYSGFLVGETLMRAAFPGAALSELTSSLP